MNKERAIETNSSNFRVVIIKGDPKDTQRDKKQIINKRTRRLASFFSSATQMLKRQ